MSGAFGAEGGFPQLRASRKRDPGLLAWLSFDVFARVEWGSQVHWGNQMAD
ncbi:hypothetical protein SERLADRAFT_435471 [Serpula lacrymans var. lacrymans S7.9]|uniref:Uncharacterized protein n=1 Tax=Serpula lacrymans var. lacrymans (strain S7.9) TaxID=578457 RepID=F8NPM0_SERL9|nr:uncharacterized protein SERLADRAFT_435471 [Serpula lacrymans var. lacrymans S7.9]EGO27711.1 hypothetical protein SERLADRAFT_435471 [Serpula lacrymans var. lacrymans S7.9]